MDSLPNFLTHGAPLARFARESSANNTGRVVRWGYLGQFLLGMSHWPLRAPTPLVYCEAHYRPHLGHFWANVTYFATSCLCIYLMKPNSSVILK